MAARADGAAGRGWMSGRAPHLIAWAATLALSSIDDLALFVIVVVCCLLFAQHAQDEAL
jgi:hypothetical protein